MPTPDDYDPEEDVPTEEFAALPPTVPPAPVALAPPGAAVRRRPWLPAVAVSGWGLAGWLLLPPPPPGGQGGGGYPSPPNGRAAAVPARPSPLPPPAPPAPPPAVVPLPLVVPVVVPAPVVLAREVRLFVPAAVPAAVPVPVVVPHAVALARAPPPARGDFDRGMRELKGVEDWLRKRAKNN